MAKFKITAPEPSYVGSISGVQFRDGVAEVDDNVPTVAAVLNYCRNAGYLVEPAEEPSSEPEPEQVAAEAPKRGRAKAAAKQESKTDEGAAAPKQEEDQ